MPQKPKKSAKSHPHRETSHHEKKGGRDRVVGPDGVETRFGASDVSPERNDVEHGESTPPLGDSRPQSEDVGRSPVH